MATSYTITIDDGDRPQPVLAGERHESCRRLAELFRAMGSGHVAGPVVTAHIDGARATTTVSLADAEGSVALVVNGVSMTAAESAATGTITFDDSEGALTTTIDGVEVAANCAAAVGTLTLTNSAGALTTTIAGVAVAANCAAADGTLTLSTASGTLTATIAGVLVTVEFNTDDDTTADDLAAAIEAEEDLDLVVSAVAAGPVVTLTSLVLGTPGDAVTVVVTGTGLSRSGATLTGGSDEDTAVLLAAAIEAEGDLDAVVSATVDGDEVVLTSLVLGTPGDLVTVAVTGTGLARSGALLTGGDDEASAVLLAAAIEAEGDLDEVVSATAALGVVTLTALVSGEEGEVTLAVTGTGIIRSGATLAGGGDDAEVFALLQAAIEAEDDALVTEHVTFAFADPDIVITAKHPGHVGNAVTVSVTGTGLTAPDARLEGGDDTTITFTF